MPVSCTRSLRTKTKANLLPKKSVLKKISVVYQPYNDNDISLYTPSQVFFLLLRPPHSCFVFVYFQTCGVYKKTLRMKQKPVLWLTAGNRGIKNIYINRQIRFLKRMIIVDFQKEDNGAMIWNNV